MKSSHVQIENNYFVNVYVYVFMNGRQRSKSSANSKEQLDSPSSASCIGEEGKLLVKIIKASGLCGKVKSGSLSPYCIVSTSNPLQRKRTTMVRDNENPFWNEYFTFDINPKTKEITLDLYDYEKTEKDSLCHLEDNEFTEEQGESDTAHYDVVSQHKDEVETRL